MNVDEFKRQNEYFDHEYDIRSKEYRESGTLYVSFKRLLFVGEDVAINIEYDEISSVEYMNPIPQYWSYVVGLPLLFGGSVGYILFKLAYAQASILLAVIGLALVGRAVSSQWFQHAIKVHTTNRTYTFTVDEEDADLAEAMRNINETIDRNK